MKEDVTTPTQNMKRCVDTIQHGKKKRGCDKMFGVMRKDGICHENLGIYIDSVENYRYRMSFESNIAVPKDYINFWKSGHKCEHEGCFKDGSVECHVPAEQDIELIEHLCPDCAYGYGYCSLCGSFWGGIESFDFNNPSHLCEHCQEQIKDENCEEDEEDSLWYEKP